MSLDFRFLIAATVLASTALVIQTHYRNEIIPAHQPLASIPLQLGAWRGTDEPIDSEDLEVLGKGDFLKRIYRRDSGSPSQIEWFMAYFPTQRTGDTIHSPLNCLPGSGWFPLETKRTTFSVAGHPPFQVNRAYVAKGDDRALVLYWYWAHHRGVASEYWAKFYLVADSIRLNRSDGALIRITARVGRGETPDAAQQALIAFSQQLIPLIDTYVPR
ncbi:MAG: exosortase C-terminal domain/associated protein EpsI [Candidatus Sulfotelmatobacter sp.]